MSSLAEFIVVVRYIVANESPVVDIIIIYLTGKLFVVNNSMHMLSERWIEQERVIFFYLEKCFDEGSYILERNLFV